MVKIIATDLDGTLFYPKKPIGMIPRKNKKFLLDFIASGGKVVVVSSRGHFFCNKFLRKTNLPVDWIGCDGTYIRVNGKILYQEFFEAKQLTSFIAEVSKSINPSLFISASVTRPMVLTRTNVDHLTNFGYFVYQAVQGTYREPFVRSDHIFYNDIEKGETYKLMMMIGISKKKQLLAKDLTEKLKVDYPQFEFTWLNQFIEVTPKGCTKATGVLKYLDYIKESKDNVLVIGDSGNDAPMFDLFYENSYCMAHAPEDVRKRAKHTVSKVCDLRGVVCPSEDKLQ